MDTDTFAFARGLPQRRKVLGACESLFLKGQRVSSVFFVEEGSVRLVRSLGDGSSAVMHVARAQDWIAESSIFSDVYHCDAFAEAPSTVLGVSKTLLLKQFAANPATCIQFAEVLAHQLRTLRGMHEIVRIRRAEERVMRWLQLQVSGDPPTFRIRGTWTQVAEELAMTREALYRTLSRLRTSGVLDVSGDLVTLHPKPQFGLRKKRIA